ncbi:MAG: GNAT family N-acetyltransferase [Phycisphaerae bacterium]|nr:GNAT family N-acetyltransferase [Phycisphaerae bacterium]
MKVNELAKLFVDPNCHSQDIGTMLFDSAEQIISKAGYKEMIVGVMARSAIGFYKKMGMSIFEEKTPEAGAFAGCKIPLMRKVLRHA